MFRPIESPVCARSAAMDSDFTVQQPFFSYWDISPDVDVSLFGASSKESGVS